MAKKESSIKSFVLRVDTETMDAIEKWAADEFRSTNAVSYTHLTLPTIRLV